MSESSESDLKMSMQAGGQLTIERKNDVEIFVLYPDGLGFGEGTISVKDQLETSKRSDRDDGLTEETLQVGTEVIMKNDSVFKPVHSEANDDGCGDGRNVCAVYKYVPVVPESDEVRSHRQRVELKKSLLRAKLFGGGLIAASSMWRVVIGGDVTPGDSVLEDRKIVADLLHANEINFGGHTDNHAKGEFCGCGAIDKYTEITANALKYRDKIEEILQVVLGGQYEDFQDGIGYVFSSYQDQVDSADTYFADASGKKTKELLENSGAVIKELEDDHLEDFVVINDVEGETFDQRAFDEILRERGVKGTAQAFVVDLWRGRMYADFIADKAAESGKDRDQSYRRALADFLIRTLATSGTLTKGDQRVILRRKLTGQNA